MSLLGEMDPAKRELMERHLQLVVQANERVNLTRIEDFREGLALHVEDSLAGLEEVNASPAGRYADLGSGGGFPGVPLAIATGRETLLVDARKKKMDVMAEIVSELGLSGQISTYSGRAELLARSQGGEFSVVTARALAKLSVLMELASPLLSQGGMLVCYKANVSDEEMEHALEVQKMTGLKFNGMREFVLADVYQRAIVTFRKEGRPSVKLPRLEGAAQKNPL